MKPGSPLRVSAFLALLLVVAGIAAVLLGGDEPYRVRANFVSASQLVAGNLVRVGGEEVGKVEDIRLTDDSQAEVTFTVDADYAPLRADARAVIRIQSLSGVANRYIDLQLGAAGGAEIADGGVLQAAQTESAVDVDQLFNTFEPRTREDTKKTIKLFSEFTAGNEEANQEALHFLNPALASSSRLFDELSANDTMLSRFVVETSQLVTDLGSRDEELSELVVNLAQTTDAHRLPAHGAAVRGPLAACRSCAGRTRPS